MCFSHLKKKDIDDEIKKSDIEEEREQQRRKSIDDLWSEIREDDKSVEVPQVEKVSITLKPDESEKIEVAIESIEAEAEAIANLREEKVEKQIKVSTACGPSPDREIEEILKNVESEKPITKARSSSKISIGTSPPPQSISTQVRFFFLEIQKNSFSQKIFFFNLKLISDTHPQTFLISLQIDV